MDEFITNGGISLILVFIEGLLSFFSPCVLPLIPVFMSYLAGNPKEEIEDGVISYNKKQVFLHTVCFIFGISFSFFILGMSFSTLGNFFNHNKTLFTRIGGILIIVLALFQLGIFEFKFLQNTKKLSFNFLGKTMNPLIALIMGFTFSFAWTPCVGPALSSVLILASSAKNAITGNLLVLLYTLGFIIPFLALGLFTTKALEFLNKSKNLIKYTKKIGGVILLIMGIMTFTGWINGVSGYLSTYTYDMYDKINRNDNNINNENVVKENRKESVDNKDINNGYNVDNQQSAMDNKENEEADQNNDLDENHDTTANKESTNEEEQKRVPIIDFTLEDQYGNTHTLSDYKGKVVFLNFWATWCGPCQIEMPDIEELYNEYNLNQDEVVILGVSNPRSADYPDNIDIPKEDVQKYLEDNEYTFPVVFDTTSEVFNSYYVNAYPTTFMIDKEGYIVGYAPGMLTKDIMKQIIQFTIDSTN